VGDLHKWVHLDAIQALLHHATGVIAAIFIFALTARLIAYLVPDGRAKMAVVIIDDIILLAVFALAGWRLLLFMWFRPHLESPPNEAVASTRPHKDSIAGGTDALIADCGANADAAGAVSRCLAAKDDQAEHELKAVRGRMTAEMTELDKERGTRIGVDTFDAAEQAFLQYRDAECEWRSRSAGAASPGNLYQACAAMLTRQRAAQIDEVLRETATP
jgi:uncharacterized protein YecT (DUF1311 family)